MSSSTWLSFETALGLSFHEAEELIKEHGAGHDISVAEFGVGQELLPRPERNDRGLRHGPLHYLVLIDADHIRPQLFTRVSRAASRPGGDVEGAIGHALRAGRLDTHCNGDLSPSRAAVRKLDAIELECSASEDGDLSSPGVAERLSFPRESRSSVRAPESLRAAGAILDIANGSSPDDLGKALDELFEFLPRHSTDGRAQPLGRESANLTDQS